MNCAYIDLKHHVLGRRGVTYAIYSVSCYVYVVGIALTVFRRCCNARCMEVAAKHECDGVVQLVTYVS